MKATVLKPFRDKHTKEVYKKDQVIEVSKKRLAEINKNLGDGFVEAVPSDDSTESEKGKENKAKSR